jgi:hypothetical protein
MKPHLLHYCDPEMVEDWQLQQGVLDIGNTVLMLEKDHCCNDQAKWRNIERACHVDEGCGNELWWVWLDQAEVGTAEVGIDWQRAVD